MILIFLRNIASTNSLNSSSKINNSVPIQYTKYDSLNLEFSPFDNLHLENVIGKGKFSIVYKAHWNGKAVAAKYLKPISTIRLKKELYLLKKIQNLSNVLHFIGLSGDIYSPIIITDIYPNDKIHNISKSDFSWLFLTLFNTISAVHNESVFHRDLKWNNILISIPLHSLSIIERIKRSWPAA